MSIVQVMFLPSKLGYLFLDFLDSITESLGWIFDKDFDLDVWCFNLNQRTFFSAVSNSVNFLSVKDVGKTETLKHICQS